MAIIGWYYLHQNGDLIYKRELGDTAADIRESDFARGLWPMDPNDRAGAWRICVEGLAAGARKERVMELAKLWQCDDEDAPHYAHHLGGEIYMDGNQWCVVGPGFRNLQQDCAGFGDTPVEAFAALAKAVGYTPSKMWGHTFKSLLEAKDPASGQFGVGA